MIACLLPVRNGAADLPGYLRAAQRVADVVLALDDGSTDATADLLRGSPLVEVVGANPAREGFAAWDDGANRQRLLDAAIEHRAAWVLWLDIDERLDRADAAALRRFAATDALPGCAYGLELHRMWGKLAVAGFTRVYRVYAPAPGQRLPARRLHFNPVPTEIPRRAWIPTTIRVRHLDSPRRLAARRRKYGEVDPEARFERWPSRLLETPSREEIVRWSPRDPGLPVLDTDRALGASGDRRTLNRPRLLCLLPVRNGEAELLGYLDCVREFADAVIALDDGSTDATSEILEADPLVRRVLRNPRREGFAGWDDAENRARLLRAVGELHPDWVLWLDADERIDPQEGRVLRDFLAHGADRRCAYGFRIFRMVGDDRHYDAAGLWVYRLFAWRPDQRLPRMRLHLVPIPLSIGRAHWRKTTIRIKHLAGVTTAQRRARFRKYQEADADHAYQADYGRLLDAGHPPRPWPARPPGLPVLADPAATGAAIDLHSLDLDAPALSAIIIAHDDREQIEDCVRSVVGQNCPERFEVIVVASGSDGTAEVVKRAFPQVTLVELPGEALPGRARNAGLARARGDYVSFPGSHVRLAAGSLAARLRAHQQGYAMVTGTIVNGTDTRAGWASYFLDHFEALPGRPSGPLQGAPAHCSYARDFVVEIGGFPEDMRAGEDTVVNRELARRGHVAYRASEIQLTHRSPCTTSRRLVRHHFVRGRALGRILLDEGGRGQLLSRRFLRAYGIRYPPRRLAKVRRAVDRWGMGLRGEYARSRPLIAIGAASAWVGLWIELLRPRGEDRVRRSAAPARPGRGHRDGSAAVGVPQDLLAADRYGHQRAEGLEAPTRAHPAELPQGLRR